MRKVKISIPAKKDLQSVRSYTLKTWGKAQVPAYIAEIKAKFNNLRDTPGMGTNRSNGLRSHPVGKHIIYYRYTTQQLIVVRVLHQSMDAKQHLGL